MTAEEIRKVNLDKFYSNEGIIATFMRELCAQIAELNELLKKYMRTENS